VPAPWMRARCPIRRELPCVTKGWARRRAGIGREFERTFDGNGVGMDLLKRDAERAQALTTPAARDVVRLGTGDGSGGVFAVIRCFADAGSTADVSEPHTLMDAWLRLSANRDCAGRLKTCSTGARP